MEGLQHPHHCPKKPQQGRSNNKGMGKFQAVLHDRSKLAPHRVNQTTDVVKEGDKVWVKLMGFDDRGKVRLSMKVVDQETGKEITEGAKEAS